MTIVFRMGENDLERTKKLNALAQGKVMATTFGSFVLTSNSALTTVTDPLFTASCVPLTFPASANATAQVPYVAARTNGEVTFGHTSDAVSGRTYLYAVLS